MGTNDEYGYSDLGVLIGATPGEPNVTDYGQADLRPFAMGALAQHRDYQPTAAQGTDLWGYQMGGRVVPPQDVEKAMNMAMSFSGGGLKVKEVAPALGSVLNPRLRAQADAVRHLSAIRRDVSRGRTSGADEQAA